MATNVFHTPETRIPDGDSRVIRVPFEESQVGARKGHLPKLTKRPAMSIVHVKSGGAS